MQGAVLYGPRDVRFEERDNPKIIQPTDAVIRMSATCVCGSDLWPYRGIQPTSGPTPFGHEYCGIVEEVGSAVRNVKPGQFVIGSFAASDNTCPHCRAGYTTSCQHREWMVGAQATMLRVPLADGTLVPTPEVPSADLVPSLLTLSDSWPPAGSRPKRRPGGHVGYVGVPHGVQFGGEELFYSHVYPHVGPAPARRFQGYRAMDERRAIKTLLQP